MSQALDDFRQHCDVEGIVLDGTELLEYMADWLTCKGVKIGGIYRHFKGKVYEVTGLRRDADDWNKWLVDYQEVNDGTHKASRPVADFLSVHPEHGVRRFVLVA